MIATTAKKEFIFGDERPFASCHASTLVVLPDGAVLSAWFGGSREGSDDVAIWCSRRDSGGWSAPQKVADEDGLPHWNPVLFVDTGGRVLLYYKVGKKVRSWHTRVLESTDGGLNWSAPRELVKGDLGGRGPVKNKPIVLHDGTWAAPASLEDGPWEAFADLSRDGGRTWTPSNRIGLPSDLSDASGSEVNGEVPPVPPASLKGKGLIQPTLWESEPGQVHMLLRSTAGYIYRSDSADGGRTWSDAYPTSLPNNNSGIDVVRLAQGALALVYNPVEKNWGPRTPLLVSFSHDNGASWTNHLTLEDEPGEYSYPAIVAHGNDVLVTYTWKRERIAFWQISAENL